ncbi:MAG TPA: alpha/beta hydrolase [Solirubrobacterales bacterium]|nr:alpha/beta hydrolase [Solirubrobacterales bacterium]
MGALRLERDEVSLHALDFGGRGPPVILLHGLAGYAGEWADTASWLGEHHRVVAPDLRGHGESTRTPSTVAPEAFVADVSAWLDALGFEHATVLGQSFGGLIAFVTAARHPERVACLVVAEASPAPDPSAVAEVRSWLESWPLPFPDVEAAIRFFGDGSLRAQAWALGLEAREDGLWPRFDQTTVLEALRESASGHWDDWDSIRCPTLIVRGEHGMSAQDVEGMASRLSQAAVETVPNAGHDVHLERPAAWRAVVEPFLAAASS